MTDYESRDLATAARLAHEAMADPGDDRPSRAEFAEEAGSTALRFARLAKEEGRREAIAEVVAELREADASVLVYDEATGGDKAVSAASYIADRFLDWTPTENTYSEEAGW